MKYPELRVSMETALPPSIQSWLGHELEIRGIDSIVYSRYIVQLLQDDDLEDLECPDYMDLIFSQKLDGKKIKAKKFDKHKVNTEERKKNAAIECLQAVSEEDNGIETLVEELCNKLKELSSSSGTEFDTDTTADLSCSSTDSSDNSSSELEDPAERYYAAFPALQGQEKHATCSSPFDKDSLHVWQKNPITNIQASNDVQKVNIDSGNESENESQTKSKQETQVTDPESRKKNRYGKKNLSKGHPMKRCKKSSHYVRRGKSVPETNVKENGSRMQRLLSWPQQNYHYPVGPPPSSPADSELCHKVESLLKEILLPHHASEPSQKSKNSHPDSSIVLIHRNEQGSDSDCKREESVSPELRENDIWYTQPLEALFTPDEPRHPLYKRHSYPLLVDDGEKNENTDDTDENEVFASTVSSPLLNYCYYDNDEIFQPQQDEENGSDPEMLISSVIQRSLNDDNDEPVCPSPPIISGNFLDSTSYLDGKSVKNSRESSASTSSSASYATVTERIKDWEDQKDEDYSPSQLFPVYETLENPLFVEMSALLDREYLYSIISAEIEITNSRYTPVRQSCLLSPVMSDTLTEDLGWPSKVLFDDQLHLPLDLYQEQGEIGGSPAAAEFRMISHGRMFWQLWDVNYQSNAKVAFYPWRLEELWDLDCPRNECFWSTTTLCEFEGLLDGRPKKISLPLSNCFGNTLIPQITFDLAADTDLEPDDIFVVEDEEPEDEDILNNLLDSDISKSYNRSVSLGDFKMLWSYDERDCIMSKPQLSRSFELVPSEHSAFDDVPTKMFHVQSEPNLKLCHDNYDAGLKSLHLKTEDNRKEEHKQNKSPEEHLYYSPKTHFRPIQTPVENHDMNDYHLRDLFGGYSKTNKTPYQKYQDHTSDSGEESFVPKFKICKEFDKYIQTGDEFSEEDMNLECTNVIDESYSYNDREIDELVQAIAAKGCIFMDEGDAGSPGFNKNLDRYLLGNVTSQISTPQNVADDWNQQACSDSGYEESDTKENTEEDKTVERPLEREHIQSTNAPVLHGETDQGLQLHVVNHVACKGENPNKVQKNEENISVRQFQNKLELDSEECLASSFQEIGSWLFNDTWSTDNACQQNGLHRPSIWSSGHDDMHFSEILASGDEVVPYDPIVEHTQEDNILDQDINHFPYTHETYFPHTEFMEDDLENPTKLPVTVPTVGQTDGVLYPSVIQHPEAETATLIDEKDIVKVKLVYRKGTKRSTDCIMTKMDGENKILDPKSLMPMPVEAVYSSELEKEWLNSDSFPPPIYYRPNKNSSTKEVPRKPCSFFMEGNCRRADCKFAHDLSLITCKFWEDGDCFKGDMCPFLHGYYSGAAFCADADKNKYEFQLDDFPELKSQEVEQTMSDSTNSVNRSKKSKTASPRSTELKKSRRNYRKSSDERKHKEKPIESRSIDNKTDET